MKDVAKLAGVTQPTVSHVINGTASISKEVRERVHAAIEELQYRPNALAKGLKTIVPVDPTGEDFGQTLGRWGIGHGFYIDWPIIGPSSARDTVGRAGDLFADPMFYLQPVELAVGVSGSLRFNALGDVLPLYEDLNTVAVDPYIAMREAYVNFREAQVLH